MMFNKIIEKCSGLKIDERRKAADNYYEFVFFRADMSAWDAVLTEFLSTPKKPQGMKPSEDHLAITENYGGIDKAQILYVKGFADSSVLAMLWPWRDNEHVTLKIVRLKNAGMSPETVSENDRSNKGDTIQTGKGFLSRLGRFFAKR